MNPFLPHLFNAAIGFYAGYRRAKDTGSRAQMFTAIVGAIAGAAFFSSITTFLTMGPLSNVSAHKATSIKNGPDSAVGLLILFDITMFTLDIFINTVGRGIVSVVAPSFTPIASTLGAFLGAKLGADVGSSMDVAQQMNHNNDQHPDRSSSVSTSQCPQHPASQWVSLDQIKVRRPASIKSSLYN